MKYATLIRRESNNKQTLGRFTLFDECSINVLLDLYILELDDDGNKVQESRIPQGKYQVVRRWSKKYGTHYHIKNVDGRTLILIHIGNYHRDILGCLLPGTDIKDIDRDGYTDVVNSGTAMRKLKALAGKEFQLEIFDRDAA